MLPPALLPVNPPAYTAALYADTSASGQLASLDTMRPLWVLWYRLPPTSPPK